FCDDLLEQTQMNIGKFTSPEQASRIHYITGNTANYSTTYLKSLFRNKLRFLHIDAGHEYHEVLHTLTLAAPFMSDHGIIVMDDYFDREFPGVHTATIDYCYQTTNGLWVPFAAGGNKIYLANPVYAKQFQLFLCKDPYFKDTMRLSRIKDSIVLIMQSKLPMKSNVIQHIVENQLTGLHSEYFMNELTVKARLHSQIELAAATVNKQSET
ncbi:MAG: class I SAM-dependent methyltransferase, partial [Pararheinheimera sp.]|nr:class I SAM-dependent methyltransferase [Rheinheimera sp.]